MSVKKKSISIDGHYDRKQKNSKRIWVLVALLLIITAAVVTVGFMESRGRQQQLMQEVEEYVSSQDQNGEE